MRRITIRVGGSMLQACLRIVCGSARGITLFTLASIASSCGGDGATTPSATLTTVVVTLSASNATVGQSVNATAVGRDQNENAIALGQITWSTSAGVTATVAASGTVTCVGAGNVVITATVDGKQGQASLTVTPAAVATVSILPGSLTLDVAQSADLNATVRDAIGNVLSSKVVAWTTSDPTIVGGTTSGNTATVQGVAAGVAVITASVDGVNGTLSVTVRTTAPKPVASVTVSPASASVAIGTTVPLIATLRDAQGNVLTGRVVSWTTSNQGIANGVTLGNTATIQGVSVGTAVITAISEGSSGISTITVTSSGSGTVTLTCTGVAGGLIYATDGQYLGRLTNRFDSQSILNTFGSYGGQFSSTSMFNTFGTYGGQFNSLSAYNTLAEAHPTL